MLVNKKGKNCACFSFYIFHYIASSLKIPIVSSCNIIFSWIEQQIVFDPCERDSLCLVESGVICGLGNMPWFYDWMSVHDFQINALGAVGKLKKFYQDFWVIKNKKLGADLMSWQFQDSKLKSFPLKSSKRHKMIEMRCNFALNRIDCRISYLSGRDNERSRLKI